MIPNSAAGWSDGVSASTYEADRLCTIAVAITTGRQTDEKQDERDRGEPGGKLDGAGERVHGLDDDPGGDRIDRQSRSQSAAASKSLALRV